MKTMSGYVRLTLGRSKYLIPQEDVVAFEPVVDIDKSGTDENSIGVIAFENDSLPVYEFTSDLELSGTISETRRICVCLRHGDIQFAILGDEVDTVQSTDFSIFTIPGCMQTGNSPVRNLAVSGNKVINVITRVTSTK